jgi:agmatinase
MLADLGDVGNRARRVGELFDDLAAMVDRRFPPGGARPLFIGGDHAISWPIVAAFKRHHPNLQLIHFDAHNDLFYVENLSFHHANPIRGLLVQEQIATIASFGMRTHFDPRTAGYASLADLPLLERVQITPLLELRALLQQPERFRQALAPLAGAPCYLTIDLDVLSVSAMSGMFSAPAGAGLGWEELLLAVDLVFAELEVIAADVVELAPNFSATTTDADNGLLALLALLIDGLARRRDPPVLLSDRMGAL